MNRLLAFAIAIAVGHTSVAFAGDPIAASAAKAARETTIGQAAPQPSGTQLKTNLGITSVATAMGVRNPSSTLALQQGGTISQTGMRKRTKALIFAGTAAAFAAIAYGIDHRVRDVTPSTLGTRQD